MHIFLNNRVVVVIRPVVAFHAAAFVQRHLAHKLFNRRPLLLFAPEFEDALVTPLGGNLSHPCCRLMWVVRVEGIAQEVEPFHHHELHRFVELSGARLLR